MSNQPRIAYSSMEIGLELEIPTYSGGLGILAGDTIRAAADLQVPMVAMTLLHRKGYFYQRLDATGWQREEPVDWIVPVDNAAREKQGIRSGGNRLLGRRPAGTARGPASIFLVNRSAVLAGRVRLLVGTES